MTKTQKFLKRRRKRNPSGAYQNTASGELLRAAALGGLLVGALVLSGASPISPYWWKHLRKESDGEKEITRQVRLYRSLKRLERRRLIHVTETTEGIKLHLTTEGKNLYSRTAATTLFLDKPKLWDGKWRIVLFDIPEKHRKTRQALQKTLRNVGCYPLQKSVLITPVPCRQEIERLATFFGIPDSVVYCETESLGSSESRIRKFFGMQ